ncbi:MAG: hypothetical protein KJ043_20485, partial [Anaerolineae bacterium]|nr:hypothetical protein [Anaerolineae bacterium]
MVNDLEWAILQTVAYADIFDYPMTNAEIHRYLIGREASLDDVTLAITRLFGRYLADCDGYICLLGREKIVETRLRRA